MCVCFEIGDNRTCLKDSFKRESRAEGNLWGRDGALPRTSSDLWAHLRSNSWFVRGLADGRHFVTVSCGRWFCPVQLINCDVTWSNSVQTAFISSFNMHRNCFRYFWICEGELFPLRNLTVKKRRVENAEIARFQACDVQRSVRSALVSAPPPPIHKTEQHLMQCSPTFLAPGTNFMEDRFSTDPGGGGRFQDDSHREPTT